MHSIVATLQEVGICVRNVLITAKLLLLVDEVDAMGTVVKRCAVDCNFCPF